MNSDRYILGIDGGGSSTIGYLFNEKGKTINKSSVAGTSLSLHGELSISRLIRLINFLCDQSNLSLNDVSAIGIGLAGVSDLNQKDMLLKKIEQLNILDKTKIYSDAEIAFNLMCPGDIGLLVCIGTGIICFGKESEGKKHIVAGEGHKDDIGSGYWLGHQAVKRTLLNQHLINDDKDLHDLYKIILKNTNSSDFSNLSEIFLNDKDSVSIIASIAKDLIYTAENGNDIALSILQEGSYQVGEYILHMLEKLKRDKKNVIISGHGSVLKNLFYRKLINQSLEFEISNLQWLFSDISPAYSAGIMSAKHNNIDISIEKIVENLND